MYAHMRVNEHIGCRHHQKNLEKTFTEEVGKKWIVRRLIAIPR